MKLLGMTRNDLRDTSLIEKVESKADITGEATVGPRWKARFSAIPGRMAMETKREVGWDEMMRSA